VLRLERSGYVNVGKTNLHEFAFGVTSANPHYGTVPNPAAPGRTSGGSSGGSAAALAAGLADAALGTDSAGSIRIPAACCGVTGLKPTFGLVPLDGCWPLAPSFDHAGPMARDVAGCRAMLAALVPGFRTQALDSPGDLDVALAWTELADPLVAARVEAAASLFPRLRRIELPLPRGSRSVFLREAADVHRGLFPDRADEYGDDVRSKLEDAHRVTDAEVARDERDLEEYRDRCEELLAGVDLLVTPTLPIVPPPADCEELEVRGTMIRLTYPFNVLGRPALALPCGTAELELPASVQLVGRRGEDGLVLAAGELLEQALARSPAP
jgi:Asp-tRNA(Asn)/Glu-tRNA(Gln) amidotransferase A subunit family amidase